MNRLATAEMERLRARIAQIEKRPELAGLAPGGCATREGVADLLAAPAGVLQEVFAESVRHGAAALGFALAGARRLLRPERPAVMIVSLLREAQDLGLPYGPGLRGFGIDPDAVVLTRTESVVEFLWAIEEAVACRAVAAVVADIGGHPRELDFTASRRLSLRAASAGASVFLVRYGKEREASAAHLRWGVGPVLSALAPYDARAPGGVRWQVTLEKGRFGKAVEGESFLVDWTENGFVMVEHGRNERRPAAGVRPALPGAAPAELGDRLSQAG